MYSLKDNLKSKEMQRHFLSVYVLPLIFGLAICGLAYLLTTKYRLDKNDRLFGYIAGVGASIALYIRNRFKWLPLPDGSYINTKELASETNDFKIEKQSYNIEPANYIISFYYSTLSKLILLLCGLIMFGAGFYMISKSSIIFPSLIIIGGVFLFYSGYKEIADTSPKLKLAKEGLWANELGFRPWTSINKTEIKIERATRYSQIYLEIYLKDSDIDYPQQRLLLNDIKGKDKIKPLIDELFKS